MFDEFPVLGILHFQVGVQYTLAESPYRTKNNGRFWHPVCLETCSSAKLFATLARGKSLDESLGSLYFPQALPVKGQLSGW